MGSVVLVVQTRAVRADTQRNRKAVLDAALALLTTDGDITMAEVATAAGVTRATLYRHFTNRDELLTAAVQQVGSDIVATLLDRMQSLPLEPALKVLADEAIGAVERFEAMLAPALDRMSELARTAVPDEPITEWFAERRARGELTNSIPDDWLASFLRVIVIDAATAMIRSPSPPEQVRALLSDALVRLVV